MRFTGDIWKNHPCCVVVMNEILCRSRPAFTQKVINAIVRAQLWTLNNRAEAASILSRDGNKYLPTPEKILLRAFKRYYERIIFAEEEFLRKTFGDSYLKWAEQTPTFLPKCKNWKK
ncbi:unnamed protein product [marine sediment metagenome]|uniref:Uncharacterized protein n=1 Tax=marine sediment metagenome TaxID=412755 RepID=X1T330_9ZZZZ